MAALGLTNTGLARDENSNSASATDTSPRGGRTPATDLPSAPSTPAGRGRAVRQALKIRGGHFLVCVRLLVCVIALCRQSLCVSVVFF